MGRAEAVTMSTKVRNIPFPMTFENLRVHRKLDPRGVYAQAGRDNVQTQLDAR